MKLKSKTMKKISIILIILIILVGVWLGWKFLSDSEEPIACTMEAKLCSDGSYVGRVTPECYFTPCPKEDLIQVESPQASDTITSPLVIKGKARGYWFFEASFPIRLYDDNGELLATAIAQAQDDWMTEEFAPFTAELKFENPKTEKGTLVLEKDNPSGLQENADELKMPIVFGKVSETMKVKVYFNNNKLDPEISCNKVFSVERTVPKTQSVARIALNELLKGVFQSEKDEGFFTNINSGVKIQSLTIENGTAKVDFDEQLEFQVGGSCRVAAIRAQITETLKQFPTVDSVIISINGRTEDILQP